MIITYKTIYSWPYIWIISHFKYISFGEIFIFTFTNYRHKSKLVWRRGPTDKSVDLRSRRQGTGDRIPIEDNKWKKDISQSQS